MKKKILMGFSLTVGIISLSACAAGGDSKTLVETNSGNVSQEELYETMKDRFGEEVLQQLVYEKVLSEKYKVTDKEVNEKIDEVKKSLGDNFDSALAQSGMKDEEDLKESIKFNLLQEKAALKDVKATDKEMKEYYKNYKPEIKARHILVKEEKIAKEVKSKLDSGAKFEDLVKEYSQDSGTVKNGGDLGWFGAGKMDPQFEEAAFNLDVNKVSGPVQSQSGFHIIQVTDKKQKKSYDDMKKEIEYQVKISKLNPEELQKALDKEIKDANVEIKDKDLKGILEKEKQASNK
ncbi:MULTISPECIES: peptidylprolyl isomerase [Peribacillus]|uniref:peptidylprolyl isomerase n=1 Tax=Peribacillus TaxID=2675229 RepID=UPI000BA4F94F|nr:MULTISPECIES: peptidylprolyl isomerase [Peribacillus]MCM3169517.1 peptidylprolyl isomerase [Peribacillus frigoritolerans]PAL00977.1 peptidylprolyl isomerase [Peribacillus simplex]